MRRISRTTVLALMTLTTLAGRPVGATEDDARSDEDVMRPTKRGLRLTPAIARGFSRMWLAQELGEDLDLSEDQGARMADVLGRRAMRTAHANGQPIQQWLESLIEAQLTHNGRFGPETAPAFAKRTAPLIPIGREFLKGAVEDARPLLTAEQLAKLEESQRRALKELDRFEGKMRRWADGRAKEGEQLEGFEPEDGEAPDASEDSGRNKTMRQAKRRAEWNLRQVGPESWARFLAGAKHFFKFDDEQVAKGDQLLADYEKQADGIMTDEWKKRMRRNRVMSNLQWALKDLPKKPWLYHLNREFTEAVEPVKELGRSFRQEVFALATDEQREAALARVRELAEKHGLTLDEPDAAMLGLARE